MIIYTPLPPRIKSRGRLPQMNKANRKMRAYYAALRARELRGMLP